MADNNNSALTIFEGQNLQTLAKLGPWSLKQNQLSHSRCLAAGSQLLLRVRKEGMSDDLDKEIAAYIEKAKLTVKKMNEKRAPVTQLFDKIRNCYTNLENDITPAKVNTIPYQLQVHRDKYAKQKHDEEERRRREEAERIAKDNARTRYRADVEDDYRTQFSILGAQSISDISDLVKLLTPGNYDMISRGIRDYSCDLPDSWTKSLVSHAIRPAELTMDEADAIRAEILNTLLPEFRRKYTEEVAGYRDETLDRLPSKLKELERIARASAEEAARLKADMEAKDRAEAERAEAERKEREAQEAAVNKLAAQKQEMGSLFDLPVAQPVAYQPKASVKKKIVISSREDIMKIISFWWLHEAEKKSIEELSKEFKKQINFANASANSKENRKIIEGITYVDEVKAK